MSLSVPESYLLGTAIGTINFSWATLLMLATNNAYLISFSVGHIFSINSIVAKARATTLHDALSLFGLWNITSWEVKNKVSLGNTTSNQCPRESSRGKKTKECWSFKNLKRFLFIFISLFQILKKKETFNLISRS